MLTVFIAESCDMKPGRQRLDVTRAQAYNQIAQGLRLLIKLVAVHESLPQLAWLDSSWSRVGWRNCAFDPHQA